MPEFKDKYRIDAEEVQQNCYFLLTLFFASREKRSFMTSCEIHELRHTKGFRVLSDLYEKARIKETLIATAINLRIIDDLMRHHGRTEHCTELRVGFLESPPGTPKIPATIRDACNKIIHTASLEFVESAPSDLDQVRYLMPIVFLFGKDRGKEWKATIEIKEFVQAAFHMSRSYEDDWDVS